MIINTYYTPSYEEDLKKYLLPSVEKFGLKYDFVPVKDMGNWSYNTYYTAPVLLEMLDKHQQMIVKVGADSVFHAYPKYFDELEKTDFDIAITFISGDPIHHADCSVVIANNTSNARKFLKLWDDKCKEKMARKITSVFSDEDVLDENHKEAYELVKLVRLEHHYGQSWHFDRKIFGDPIIEDLRTSWNHERNRV